MKLKPPAGARISGLSFLVPALSVFAAAPTLAQSAQQNRMPAGIEEIVVTAERRETSVQSTPLAITALGGNEVRDAGIVEIADLATRVPNFSYSSFTVTDPQLFIRGIGSTQDGAGGDPSIVVSQDDLVFGRSTGQATTLFDIERIEVLRGPQGTLFGRNAAGGVARYITNKPSYVSEGMISLMPVGDHNRFESELMYNMPFSDAWAMRVAAKTVRHDGYNHSTVTGRDVDDGDTVAARVHLQYEPSSAFRALLTANYSADRIYGDTRTPLPRGSFVDRPGVELDPDPRVRQPNFDGYLDRDIYSLALDMDIETGIGVLTSITGVRSVEFDWLQDIGGVLVPPFVLRSTNLADETADQFSQEFRLAGAGLDGRLQWVGGIFFSSEDIQRDETFSREFAGVPSNPSFLQDLDSQSIALFASVTYSLTDRLNITAGLRQSWDEKDGRFSVVDNFMGSSGSTAPALEEYDTGVSASWNAFTPRLTLDYQHSDDLMTYLTVSRGYKAGGFDSAPASANAARVPYDPEYVWNYEGGVRLDFWDKRARVNVTGFDMSYTDLQVQQLIQLTPGDPATQVLVIDNAANASIYGLEVEFMIAPTDNFRMGGTYGLLDATFDDFITSTGADLAGNTLRRAPEYSYSVYGAYVLDVPKLAGALESRVEYAYRGDQFLENENEPFHLEKSYGLLDASLSYVPNNGDWRISLWGKNLTDELYRVNSVTVSDTGFSKLGAPRTWGLSIRHDFGG